MKLPPEASEGVRTQLKEHDVLISITADIGVVGYVDARVPAPAYINQHIALVRFDASRACGKFVSYFLASEKPQRLFRASTDVGAKAGMSLITVQKIQTALPPRPEQHTIATALSDVDALLGTLDQLIAKKRNLKQAAMQQLLTGQTRLPGFHDDWQVIQLGDVANPNQSWSFTGGPFGSNLKSSDYTEDGVRIIQLQNIGDGEFKDDYEIFTSIAKADELFSCNIYPGEIILSKMGDPVARACIIPPRHERYLMCSDGIRLAVNPRRFDTNFVFAQINAPDFRNRAANAGTGSTRKRIGLTELRGLKLSCPLLHEQTAIAAVLTDMDAELAALEQRREKTRALKLAMMQELLTGRIRLVERFLSTAPDSAVITNPVNAPQPAPESHSWQFNEAVVLAVLVKQFGSEQFPLGRKRRTKLAYLMHRHVEHTVKGFLKKAAGPYDPAVRYKGPEGIALTNGYVRPHVNGRLSGFIAAEKIECAESYFSQWYGREVLAWLEQFRKATNDELELLATVDMAIEDLRRANAKVDVETVKSVLRNHPDWAAKLQREIFSDANIARAIRRAVEFFP